VASPTPYDEGMSTLSDLDAALSYHGPLGRWYAEPMSEDTLRKQMEQWSKRRQQRLRQGRGDSITLRIACAVARFQLGENVESEIAAMAGLYRQRRSPRALALLHLIYGQLLATQQLPGTKEKLAQGFQLANPLLHPQDYFSLMHRHRLLALLPVTSRTEALSLKTLLQTAAVRERLETTKRPQQASRPNTFF
jgi:hypothetical protein